jgi:hypothetical protein
MIKAHVTLEETAEFLNELLKTDPTTINALFNMRIYCNQGLAEHPTVQVGCQGEGKHKICQVGFIGILNGLFGSDERGWGRLVIDVDNGAIKGFRVLDEKKITQAIEEVPQA